MKATKIISVFIAIFFLVSILNAANPSKDKSDEMSTKAIERINKTIALDSIQNATLKIRAKACYLKIDLAKTKKDKHEKMAITKKASEEFITSFDSILTPDQREQVKLKRKATKDAIIAQNSNKKISIKK